MGSRFFRYRYILTMRALIRDLFLRVAGTFRKITPGIHIINSHFVTPHRVDIRLDYQIFEKFLKNLQKHGKLISVSHATESLASGNIPTNETLIALTFDDGFEECYTIIAPLLEKYGCKGAFFINANYIDSDENYQEAFNNRIATFTKKPMSWQQVVDLHNRGHIIGSHNLDHLNFSELSREEINFQLKKNKEILEEKLQYDCEYFAWTYGQFIHFPEHALIETQKLHKYIFSGTDYKNYFSFAGAVINRRHLEANWKCSHVRFFLSCKKQLSNFKNNF